MARAWPTACQRRSSWSDRVVGHNATRSLARHEGPTAAPLEAVLVVDAAGAWFCPMGAPRVDLQRYQNVARLLAALAAQHGAAPGTPVAHADLVRAAWPDEHIRPDAAALRLRTAVAQLRRLGLRDALVTRPGGYLLINVAIHRAAPDDARD